jgi:subtilisin family serine protease
MKRLAGLFSVFLLGVMILAQSEPQEREVLVKFKGEVSQAKRDSILNDLGLQVNKEIKELNVLVCSLPRDLSFASLQQSVTQIQEIDYVEANVTYRTLPQDRQDVQAKLHYDVNKLDPETYPPQELLIKVRDDATQAQVGRMLQEHQLTLIKPFAGIAVYQCRFPAQFSTSEAILACAADTLVEYVEPNYTVHMDRTPNDPNFGRQYGLHNRGQDGGKSDADIDAPEAWDIQTGGRNVLVGIVDTGIEYDHEDLRANIWNNPGETGGGKESNRIDDDNNGYVDDWRGWDFKGNDNDPRDDNGHGTHVAGITAAVGNNGTGVSGVAWRASLVGLKFLGSDGSGTTADAVEAIIYAANNEITLLNNSWGSTELSRTLEDAIKYASDRSVLFMAAAGNDNSNNDTSPHYPSNHDVENVISVAASTNRDDLASFTNFGERTVDLAAPGNNIFSTYRFGRYQTLSGTSMATPFVTGAAALVKSEFPNISLLHWKLRLLGGVDHPSDWRDRVLSDGRLNAAKTLSRSPIIALTTDRKNNPDTIGPYKISTFVIDDGSVSSVNLVYILNDTGVADTLNMASVGQDSYEMGIPGQPLGTRITYFILANDNQGNSSRSRNFGFTVAEPSKGCCGQMTVTTTNPDNRFYAGLALLANLVIFFVPFSLLKRYYRKHS